MDEKIHAAILFTDVKDYSKLPDHLYPTVDQLNKTLQTTLIDTHRPIYSNSWGDAFFVCLSSCEDAAEVALDIRDKFRTFNWRRKGFDHPLAIRIGLHFAQVTLLRSGELISVMGKGINTGARIEPIVTPGSIYCSRIFKDTLDTCEDDRFFFCSLGTKKLAKEFGEMSLFELSWSHEQPNKEAYNPSSSQEKIYHPRANTKITDRDKRHFTDRTFEVIRCYFHEGAKEAPLVNPSSEILIRNIDATRLHIEYYLHGDLKHAALIRNGGPFSSYEIVLSEGVRQDIHNTNSFSEILNLKEHEGNLTWEAVLGLFSSSDDTKKFDTKSMTPNDVAKYLWIRFIEQ